jgi:hypothetical protein
MRARPFSILCLLFKYSQWRKLVGAFQGRDIAGVERVAILMA